LLNKLVTSAKDQYSQGVLSNLLGSPQQSLNTAYTDVKNLFNPAYMKNVQGMSLEDAKNLALDANPMMAGVIGYRGLTQPFTNSIKNNVEWFSTIPELANTYAGNLTGANVIKQELGDVGKNSIDLGFRNYMTEVKKGDVLDRVERSITDAFNNGKISKKVGLSKLDEIDKLRTNNTDYKRVHEWISQDKSIPKLLKDSGYDSISHIENGNQTYGLLNN
jgi:hypothetical protein